MPSFAESHPLSRAQNATNALWLLLVCAPCVVFGYYFTHHCPPSLYAFNQANDDVWWMDKLSAWENTCRFGAQHPLIMVNVIMFIKSANNQDECMDIILWLASRAQDSTWLIDPLWTIIPLLIAQFYWTHPFANGNPTRAWSVMALLWVWSSRLTYSYFRREEWHFGAREDWRFAELRRQYTRTWWWSSFFLAYVSQHIFLFGVTAPLWTAFSDPRPRHFGVVDVLCLALSAFGIGLAARADSTLRSFMKRNEEREAAGQPKVLLLAEGPWRYSRHANHVGEQIIWWGLGLMAYNQSGDVWMLLGAFLNTVCLGVATQMVEDRMVRNESRRALYEQYQREVAIWIPIRDFVPALKAMLPGETAPPPAWLHAHRE